MAKNFPYAYDSPCTTIDLDPTAVTSSNAAALSTIL